MCSCVQRLYIKHVDATTAIADQTSILQFAGYKGDAAALHAQHLRQEFSRSISEGSLRKRRHVVHSPLEEPTCRARAKQAFDSDTFRRGPKT